MKKNVWIVLAAMLAVCSMVCGCDTPVHPNRKNIEKHTVDIDERTVDIDERTVEMIDE